MLNAALGSNMVNAMELMQETDPVGRFQMLRSAILDTGLSFDRMSYYQKIFYKDALGLSDVGDLALMLSGDMKNLAGATQRNSKEWAEFKNQAASVQSLMDLFQATIASMVPVLTPLMKLVKSFFTMLNSDGAKGLRMGIQAFIAWKMATKSLAFVFGGITTKLWSFVAAAAPAAAGGEAVGFSIGAIGAAAFTAAPGLAILMGVFGTLAAAMYGMASAAGGVTNMFSMFGKAENFTTAVKGIKAIKAELRDMPDGTIERTQAMNSVAVAARSADDSSRLISAISAITAAGGSGGGGGGGSSQHTVHIQFNNKMFHDEVIKIVGKEISRRNRQ